MTFTARFYAVKAFGQPDDLHDDNLIKLQARVRAVLKTGYCNGHALFFQDNAQVGIMRKVCSRTISAKSSGESVRYTALR